MKEFWNKHWKWLLAMAGQTLAFIITLAMIYATIIAEVKHLAEKAADLNAKMDMIIGKLIP